MQIAAGRIRLWQGSDFVEITPRGIYVSNQSSDTPPVIVAYAPNVEIVGTECGGGGRHSEAVCVRRFGLPAGAGVDSVSTGQLLDMDEPGLCQLDGRASGTYSAIASGSAPLPSGNVYMRVYYDLSDEAWFIVRLTGGYITCSIQGFWGHYFENAPLVAPVMVTVLVLAT